MIDDVLLGSSEGAPHNWQKYFWNGDGDFSLMFFVSLSNSYGYRRANRIKEIQKKLSRGNEFKGPAWLLLRNLGAPLKVPAAWDSEAANVSQLLSLLQ